MDRIKRITFIGAGNLATQLAKALFKQGIEINQVYSRTLASAELLAEQLNAEAITNMQLLNAHADLYVFAVKDDALISVLQEFPYTNKPIAHTAGSIPMAVLSSFSTSYGVFYPLQTFSKTREADFQHIPFCIESSSEIFTVQLKQLAARLSTDVRDVNSVQRQSVHLAAVFVCNFVNYMYSVGYDLMEEYKLDFNLLKPLIEETAKKVMYANPKDVQTGPAVRFDEQVMNKHLQFLENKAHLQELYSFVSKQIFNMHQNK